MNKSIRGLIIYNLLIVITIPTKAQKIAWDEMREGNIRSTSTEGIEMKIDNATYKFSMAAFSEYYSKKYYLIISSIWHMEDNCTLMIKLGNEENVKLIAHNVNSSIIDYPSYNPIIGGPSASGILSTQKVDYYVSIYNLNNELLDKIEKHGIIKIRIGTYGNTYNEQNWKKDKLGKYLKKSHIKIEEQLQNPIETQKSIENGF
jgi:hypothetical protein